jgi:hypothetical protein
MSILGHLVWFTVNDKAEIDHNKLCSDILLSGSDTMLPRAPKGSDVFKRSCKAAKTAIDQTYGETNGPVHWRAAETDNLYVYRELTDDSKTTVLASVGFHKPTERIAVVKLYTDHVAVTGAVDGLQAFIDANSTVLTAYAIREFVRRTIETEFLAVNMRQGYFVADEFTEKLTMLAAVVNGVDHCTMDIVPLEDSLKNMVDREFGLAVQKQADAMAAEIAGVLKNEKTKITKDRFMLFHNAVDTMKQQAALVGAEVGPIAKLDDLLQTLVGRMKV